MRRITWPLLIVAGCWTAPPARAPLPSHRAAAPPARVLALPVVAAPCSDGTDGCAQDPLITSTMVSHRELAGCALAPQVELRAAMTRTSSRLCHVVLAGAGPSWFVDAGLVCELHGERPRVTLARASCAGDTLALELTADAVTYRVRCTSRGGAGEPPTCTRTALPATTNRDLADFLAQVTRAARAHDWPALLALCSAEHRAAQLGQLGMAEPAYLAEILGLHYVDNTINDGEPVTLDALATIAGLEVTDLATTARGSFELTGWVMRTTRPRLRLTLRVRREGARLVLFGALG